MDIFASERFEDDFLEKGRIGSGQSCQIWSIFAAFVMEFARLKGVFATRKDVFAT